VPFNNNKKRFRRKKEREKEKEGGREGGRAVLSRLCNLMWKRREERR
jgi:hypothetical protein